VSAHSDADVLELQEFVQLGTQHDKAAVDGDQLSIDEA
jgi:hypothetical protein